MFVSIRTCLFTLRRLAIFECRLPWLVERADRLWLTHRVLAMIGSRCLFDARRQMMGGLYRVRGGWTTARCVWSAIVGRALCEFDLIFIIEKNKSKQKKHTMISYHVYRTYVRVYGYSIDTRAVFSVYLVFLGDSACCCVLIISRFLFRCDFFVFGRDLTIYHSCTTVQCWHSCVFLLLWCWMLLFGVTACHVDLLPQLCLVCCDFGVLNVLYIRDDGGHHTRRRRLSHYCCYCELAKVFGDLAVLFLDHDFCQRYHGSQL